MGQLKEAELIELTEQQVQAVAAAGKVPAVLVDPNTRTPYVLLRQDDYERLTQYDDSAWTDEEMELLAWETGKLAGWDDMDEYDHYSEKT